MANCDKVITRDLQANCDNNLLPDLENLAIILNRDDIDFDSSAYGTRTNVLEDTALKATKTGYYVHQIGDSFSGVGSAMEIKRFRNTFANTFPFVIFDNDPEIKDVIDGIANGRFVVVFENKYKNSLKAGTPGDSTFEVMGWERGLKATKVESLKYDADTAGAWVIELKEEGAPRPPLTFYNTTEATTRAAFAALVTV